ncbi:GAF domain-containing protein [Bradyrhizobium japonicum]|uniref:HWE histidine kinase domain-containing protein n=1 Tax=Bradyrhizobium japonicum TaxID=375 RepID=UPI001BAE3171|nr:HWE histidine kinase domain-containing protein [Bradyrhizobium japonicum]MBR0994634.1 GAF domain-containing protein [Bradyrhizobium japonicum]
MILMPAAGTSLTSCDTEQIHLLGGIQPIGFLISVSTDWQVLRASANVSHYLEVDPNEIIGSPVDRALNADLLHDIRGRLQTVAGTGIVERLFGQTLKADGPLFDVAVHISGRETVLEFEPATGLRHAPLSVLRSMLARVEHQTNPQSIYREAARQIRALTGFDRVMVYRFSEDGTGEVVAESAASGLPSFLGLRYPASDIPVQARALYRRNYLRIIADVDAEPVLLLPAAVPGTDQLDLSMSSLRSVSPIHLEYLRNMGVRASMSISILLRGELWGLIACHHREPISVDLEVRSTAELFGQMFSYMLESREREDEAAFERRTRVVHDQIAAAFAAPDGSLRNIPEFLTGMSDYIPSDGVGIYIDGHISLSGVTPTREEFLQLVRFLNRTASGRVFATNCISDAFPPAADYPMRAAGVLSIPISRIPRDYVVFFRREVAKTVTWAGEPTKPEIVGPHGVRLTPRKSFEAWRQLVQNQSENWRAREISAAEALRATLIELVLRITDSAQSRRAAAEQSQDILIAELNHRVRNILGLVRGLVSQSAAAATDIRHFVESVDHRVRSLARAHDILTSSDWKSNSLHALLRAEIETYGKFEGQVVLHGPDVLLQPRAFTPITLVVHELVTNARKYGALSTLAGRITVTTSQDDLSNVIVAWCETGGPMVSSPTRRGFGSTILEQIIPFELNGSSSPRFLPAGYCLDLVLPASIAHCVLETEQASSGGRVDQDVAVDRMAFAPLLKSCLLVEDNLFIAIDAEDMLRSLGAEIIVIAKSVAEALAQLDRLQFTFALLDINLGAENSLPIARQLQSLGLSFAFGTGYSKGMALGEAYATVPVVAKPYHRSRMVAALTQLMGPSQSADDVGEARQ